MTSRPAISRSLWEVVPLLAARTVSGKVLWRGETEGFSTEVAGHRLRVATVDGKGHSLALLRQGETIDEIVASDGDPRAGAVRALLDAVHGQCLERERVIDGLIEGLRAMGGR